jgi:hypothetical protein
MTAVRRGPIAVVLLALVPASAHAASGVVLGAPGYVSGGQGWGEEAPARIVSGPSPRQVVDRIQWRNWGTARAGGRGFSTVPTPQNGDYKKRVRVQLLAKGLGQCPGTTQARLHGPPHPRPQVARLTARALEEVGRDARSLRLQQQGPALLVNPGAAAGVLRLCPRRFLPGRRLQHHRVPGELQARAARGSGGTSSRPAENSLELCAARLHEAGPRVSLPLRASSPQRAHWRDRLPGLRAARGLPPRCAQRHVVVRPGRLLTALGGR